MAPEQYEQARRRKFSANYPVMIIDGSASGIDRIATGSGRDPVGGRTMIE